MAIADLLTNKTPAERHAIKCTELAKLTGETFTKGRFALTIEAGPRVRDGVLEVLVSVTRDGVRLPIDGHLRFVNPPIMVPDGTFRNETQRGKEYQVPNFVENPRAALREMILGAVIPQVRP